MSTFPGAEGPLMGEGPRREYQQLDSYAMIEGLCCEEDELLAVAEHERSQEHHERLRAISAELDAIWERLRERAHPSDPPASGGAAT